MEALSLMSWSILLLDDDDYFRSLMVKLLAREGFTVYEARCGSEASALMARHRFNLAVVDYRLPDCDGMSWISWQRAAGCNVPFIFLSGIACSASMQIRLRNLLNVNLILQKPVDPKQFVSLVRAQIEEAGHIDLIDLGVMPAGQNSVSHALPDYKEGPAVECASTEADFFPIAEIPANLEKIPAPASAADPEESVRDDIDQLMKGLRLEYLAELPRNLRQLADLIELGSPEAVSEAIMEAHKMKGASGSYSYASISDLSASIERALLDCEAAVV